MRSLALISLAFASSTTACTPFEPDFTVRAGVETATVLDGEPGALYTLYDEDGAALLTLISDVHGQAHFAYLPDEHIVVETGEGTRFSIADGAVLSPDVEYEIRNDDTLETSGPIEVLAVDDPGPGKPYTEQILTGIEYSAIDGARQDVEYGFHYLEMRDGVLLSAMVRFPDRLIYGDGPWPTVIEYSGYSPSRPDKPDTGSLIANAMGFATVSVNMRGTGCSGGVYDVFNRAQHADGYDVVEIVAHQDWVLNNQVGMVGLSYPGITQLYVASTRPPSLAAIVPLSTIADPWEMQWPGGIYNKGFTRQWVEEREAQASPDGTSWVVQLMEGGDETCKANKQLSSQNIDFESFLRSLEFRPPNADDRDLNRLVRQIDVPVFLGGQFQDEQTGAQFGGMLDHFDNSPNSRFILSNGRHPDGYAPGVVFRWHEFLEFYVAERVPKVNGVIRVAGAPQFGAAFDIDGYKFPDDRFDEFEGDHAAALEAYEAEPAVLMTLENGAGEPQQPGAPYARGEVQFDSWPPAGTQDITWHLHPGGTLGDGAIRAEGADAWTFDPQAGDEDFFGPRGYELLKAQWDVDWTRFEDGNAASYLTAEFTEDTVVAGPGIAELYLRSPEADLSVQVTLTEVRADGYEVLVQSGWLRLGHRAATVGDDLRLVRSYSKEDFEPVPVDEWVRADVAIPSVAHSFRAGSRLRMTVSSPGRDHGTWLFEAPQYDGTPTFEVSWGGSQGSKLHMVTMPGIDVPEGLPDCFALRGQPCRDYVPIQNVPVE